MSQQQQDSSGTPQTENQKRIDLPEGTIAISIGLIIAGLTIYAFFKIGQEALGQDGFKPLVSLWFVMFAITPGFFLPVEQEISRAISHRRELGQGAGPVLKKVVILCAGIVVGLIALIVAMAPIVNRRLFEGQPIVTASLAIAIAVYGVFYLVKGVCSGLGKFTSYGFIVGADGGIRVVVCLILFVAGVTQLGAYALAAVVAPIIGVLIVFFLGELKMQDGPPASWSEITPNLGWLLGGSIFAAALVNAGPITVALLGDSAPAKQVTLFGNAVLLSRVPLFLFQAVQAALLPRLTRLAARRAINEFRSGLKQLVVLVIGVGVLGTIGAFAIGPNVLDLVYGGGIDRRTITLLALASAIYMLALALAQAVIALNGHKHVALGWSLAFVAYVLTVWQASDDLFLRVEIALVVSSVVGLISLAASLRMQLRSLSTAL